MTRRSDKSVSPPRLFPAEAFEGLGPSRFRPVGEAVIGRRLRAGRAARLLRGVRDHAPRWPGVYAMFDKSGRLIYVGKAKSLRARLMCYFREKSRDHKAGKILEQTRCLVWEQTGDEFSALLRELELIQHYRPKFNVQGQPGHSRYHYLAIGKSAAPYVSIVKKPTGKELGVYGPLVSRPRSEEAVRRLNDWFKLRDCPRTVTLSFRDQPEMFPTPRSPGCLRYELQTCAGPCVGESSRREYAAGVRGAKAFLDGRSQVILEALRKAMAAASQEFQFEKAMALRDRLQAFEWLHQRLSLLRKARSQSSFVYPLAGQDGVTRWYLIHCGQVRGVLTVPRTDAERRQAESMLKASFAEVPASAVTGVKVVDSVLLVAAWFRKHADDRPRLLTPHEAMRSNPEALHAAGE